MQPTADGDAAARIIVRQSHARTAQQLVEARATIERLVDGLRAIAEPDHLLNANEEAFNAHAARRMQRQAMAALTATGHEVASR